MTLGKKSFLFAFLAVFLWSTVATAFKITLENISYLHLLFFSSLTSSFFFLTIILFSKEYRISFLLIRKNLFKLVFAGFLNPTFYYLLLFKAYELLPAQEAQPLNYTWPVTISIGAVFFLGQKLNFNLILGLFISFFGVIIIASRGNFSELSFNSPLGVLFALGSSVLWAAYWIINLKLEISNNLKLFIMFSVGTILTGVIILLFDEFKLPSVKSILGSVYIGLFEMGFTFLLWLKALELSENKAATSTLAYLSPFISMIMINYILREEVRLPSLIGLLLIVTGIIVQKFDLIKRKNES